MDEEVYDNDGNERNEAREASAGDRRAIADADQAGQLDKCSFAHRQVAGEPSKMPKKDGDKSAVAFLKRVRQLGCVFQDTEPRESLSFLREEYKSLGTNSTSTIHKKLRGVKQTSEKTKVRRSE